MGNKPFIPFFTVIFFISITCVKAVAQNGDINSAHSIKMKEEKKAVPNRNFIKVNLTAIALKNYSLQYERTLNRKFSLALSYRIMPATTLPFQSAILKSVGNNDPETKKTIEEFRLSNYAFTAEVRFYLSKKGYGRGFYIAPFYRYAAFKTNDLNVFYTDSANGQSSIKLSGNVGANTGGLLLGVQSFFGKHIVLDISILGPHYGSGKGDFTGTSAKPLSKNEQNDLRNQLNNMDIPLTKKTVNVNSNGASVKLDGPWGGIRAGISLGIIF